MLLKEAQPDQSMKQSGPFLHNGGINQVDFRAPPIKSIANFLLYVFQDRKLQQVLLMAIDRPQQTNWENSLIN